MKRIIIFLLFVYSSLMLIAQVPERLSFQAIVRNSSEQLVANQGIGIRVSILQGKSNGDEVYVETQSPTTNSNGLVSIEIGAGNVEKGSLLEIDWSDGPFFIYTQIDPSAKGGTNYTMSGTTELVSVPYALHAKIAESLAGEYNESDPVFQAWDKSSSIIIAKDQVLDLGTYIESEVDPVFGAWNKSTGITVAESQVTNLGNYIVTESDPLFASWDKTSGIVISESQISSFGSYLKAETDPVFLLSTAYSIASAGSGQVISTAERAKLGGIEDQANPNVNPNWEAHQGDAEILNKPVDVSVFENDMGYVSMPQNPNAGDLFFFDGQNWTSLAKGNHGQLVAINAEGDIVWGNAPSVTTKPAINTVNGTAILKALVNANNLETLVWFEYGTTTDYGSTIDAAQSPIAGSTDVNITASLSGLIVGETYHFRVVAENILTTVFGHDLDFTITAITIGDDYGGGKVAYIFQEGDYGYVEGETHGLIVSTSNITSPTHSEWGCNGTIIGTSNAIGYGKSNTEAIVSKCPANSGGSYQIAAHVCNNLVLNGFNDWYLPNSGELSKIYENRALLGTFSNDYYWTSSEYASIYAYQRHFGTGVSNYSNKTILFRVRPIRYF